MANPQSFPSVSRPVSPYSSFHPGAIWKASDGAHINAHGGGLLFHEGVYYWYGECKSNGTSLALKGVSVYSSTDLYNWKNEGIALGVEPEGSGHDIAKGCILERPKVIFCPKTGKFAMWFHLELIGQGYLAARYGVAVSDSPTGPFQFLYSSRSCEGVWPCNMTAADIEKAKALKETGPEDPAFRQRVEDGLWLARDLEGGQMARDMTLFVDDDGKAYHIFSSEENETLHVVELTDDFLHHSDRYARILPGRSNEAPALFKKDGVYWMITSGCTGWAPNAARLSRATSIFGPWESYPNPCRGEGAGKTYGAQSTYILPVPGRKDEWIFMADQWRPERHEDGRYVWLPIQFDVQDVPFLEWRDEWRLDG